MTPVATNIPLSAHATPIENPMETVGKALTLRNAMQQGQLNNLNIQRVQQENAQRDRALAADKTLADLFAKHTAIDPSGSVNVDYGSVIKGFTEAGYGKEALQLDQQRRADLSAAMDVQKKKLETQEQSLKQLGQLAGSVPPVDFNETDPTKLNAATTTSQALALAAVKKASDAGLLPAEQAQGLVKTLAQTGYTPQVQATLQQFAKQSMTAAEQSQQTNQHLTQVREQLVADTTVQKNKLEIDEKQRGVDSSVLAAAARQGKDAYAAAWNNLPAERRGPFDPPEKYDPKNTEETVTLAGMNGQQREAHEDRKVAQDIRREGVAAMADYRQSNLNLREEALDLRRSQAGKEKAADKADQRQASSKLLSLQKQEEPIYGEMAQLQAAIKAGNVFVGHTGAVVPMSKATGGDDSATGALQQDMQARLSGLKQRVHAIIDEKYDLVEAHGGTPKVSREDAHAGVGRERSTSQPAAKPSAAAQPAQQAAKPAAAPQAKPAQSFTDSKGRTYEMNEARRLPDGSIGYVVGVKNGKAQVSRSKQ